MAALTLAVTPLNFTTLSDGVEEKLMPAITTVAPGGPDDGVIVPIAGATVKGEELGVAWPETLTVSVPVFANGGMTTVSCVEFAFVTVAATPLNATVTGTLEGMGSKYCPVITTLSPGAPADGTMLVIIGGGNGIMFSITIISPLPKLETIISGFASPFISVIATLFGTFKLPLASVTLGPREVASIVPGVEVF